MKRVLFVDHVDRILGGAEINLIELIEEAQKHNTWKIAVACRKGSKLSDALTSLSVEQFDYGFDNALNTLRFAGRFFPWSGLLSGLRALNKGAERLKGIHATFQPDAAVSCPNKDHFASVASCQGTKAKSIWWVNDLLTRDFFPLAARVGFKRFSKGAAQLVAVSNCVADGLEKLGIPIAKVRAIPNGIPLEKYEPRAKGEFRRRFGIPEDQPLFGIVGRICDWKNQRDFVMVCKEWCARGGPGHFAIIGQAFNEDLKYEQWLRDFIQRPLPPPYCSSTGDFIKRIHFVPFQNNVADALADLDVLLHMSLKPEPFGRVIVEAMAAGVPVIAADAGGAREIVRSGENGYLAQPNDVKSYVEKLGLLHPRTPAVEKMIAAGRATVEQHFTVERVYRQFDGLISTI